MSEVNMEFWVDEWRNDHGGQYASLCRGAETVVDGEYGLSIADAEMLALMLNQRDEALTAERTAKEAALAELAIATETWADEAGNVWRPSTAWAYAQSCRVRDEMRTRAESAEAELRKVREGIEGLADKWHADYSEFARNDAADELRGLLTAHRYSEDS